MTPKKKALIKADPTLGEPCVVCGAKHEFRITMTCQKCQRKTRWSASDMVSAAALEEQVASFVCPKCGSPDVRARRRRTHEAHHISYPKDVTILACYTCHQRAHGNAVITHHPFKRLYPKDIEPFMFAAAVVSAYVRALPEEFSIDRDGTPRIKRKG